MIQIQTSCTERDAVLTSKPIPETITSPLVNELARLYDHDQEISLYAGSVFGF